MKTSILSFLAILLFSGMALARPSTIDFQLRLETQSEGAEEQSEADLIKMGCDATLVREEGVCLIEKVIDERDLPYSLNIGDATFSISADGLIELCLSYGDHDASAEASLQLPSSESGNLLPLPGPLTLSVSGGDHASGVWFISGELKIIVE